jgi:hypothetical protein
MTIETWLLTIYPLLLNRTLTKAEHKLSTGELIKAYWVGSLIRVDIQPR